MITRKATVSVEVRMQAAGIKRLVASEKQLHGFIFCTLKSLTKRSIT